MHILVSSFNGFVNYVSNFFDSCLAVLDYIYSIVKTLWFGLGSLLSGIGNLIYDVLGLEFFDLFTNGFVDLSFFVGGYWSYMFCFVVLVVMLRIIIAFVFKIFRLNVDYKKDSKT